MHLLTKGPPQLATACSQTRADVLCGGVCRTMLFALGRLRLGVFCCVTLNCASPVASLRVTPALGLRLMPSLTICAICREWPVGAATQRGAAMRVGVSTAMPVPAAPLDVLACACAVPLSQLGVGPEVSNNMSKFGPSLCSAVCSRTVFCARALRAGGGRRTTNCFAQSRCWSSDSGRAGAVAPHNCVGGSETSCLPPPGMAAGMFADPSKMQNMDGMPAPAHWSAIPSNSPSLQLSWRLHVH